MNRASPGIVADERGERTMTASSQRTGVRGVNALLAAICALSLFLGALPATQAAPQASHAELIAQGVSTIPSGSMVWRIVLRQPDPAEEHPPIARHLGFTLVRKGTLLITGSERKNDFTLLSAGQASFAREGEALGRDQIGTQATDYWSIELAPTSAAKSTEGGSLVFSGAKFTPPGGRRDLQLVRDVVAANETSDLGALTSNAVLLVTSGSVTVTANGKTSTVKSSKAANLTGSATVTGGSSGGTFVVAQFGLSIEEASAAPTATATTSAIVPSRPATATATATTQPTASGRISLKTYICPAGVTMAQATPDACGGDANLGSGTWTLAGSTLSGSVDPTISHGIWEWPNLANGQYFVTPTSFPDGYSQYVIDFNPSALRQDTGLYVMLNSDANDIVIDVYFIDPGNQTPAGTATLGVNFFTCPIGTTVLDFAGHQAPHNCQQTAAPLGVILTSDALPRPLTADDFVDSGQHPSMEGDWLWTNLPNGNYTLTPSVIEPNGNWYFRRPCGDQSCPEVEASGLEVGFTIDDSGGFVLNVYYIPPSA